MYSVRQRCGSELARESSGANASADLVSCVPDSAMASAMAFAETSGLPFREVMNKSRYVGRTFIQPTRELRQLAVVKKFAPLSENVAGKRIILVDDSIVRGNTMQVCHNVHVQHMYSTVHARILLSLLQPRECSP